MPRFWHLQTRRSISSPMVMTGLPSFKEQKPSTFLWMSLATLMVTLVQAGRLQVLTMRPKITRWCAKAQLRKALDTIGQPRQEPMPTTASGLSTTKTHGTTSVHTISPEIVERQCPVAPTKTRPTTMPTPQKMMARARLTMHATSTEWSSRLADSTSARKTLPSNPVLQ